MTTESERERGVGAYLGDVDVARWAAFHRKVTAEHQVVCFKGTFGHRLAGPFDIQLAGDAQTLVRGDEGVGPLSNSF